VISLKKKLIGKPLGDKDSLSKTLTSRLLKRDLKLMKTLKKNMKAKLMDAYERLFYGSARSLR